MQIQLCHRIRLCEFFRLCLPFGWPPKTLRSSSAAVCLSDCSIFCDRTLCSISSVVRFFFRSSLIHSDALNQYRMRSVSPFLVFGRRCSDLLLRVATATPLCFFFSFRTVPSIFGMYVYTLSTTKMIVFGANNAIRIITSTV